ncbi:hypothetical protein [Spirosoma validum]|uniref:Uncharacterized protein n=1 Tax=Spirosoma validum TaxID=2771355 RepID=A0A927AXK4_9BACT|nr:hypothetical protein [Spirosoma validum]MBD2751618.1 hypothetical protein [Spirosoma validum]
MAHKDKKIASLLDNTFSSLGGDVSSTTPDDGVNLIQEWIEVVQSNVSTQWLAEPLEKLQIAINSQNTHEIEELMHNLSGITVDFANNAAGDEYKEELQNLSTVLKDFAQELTQVNTH